MHYSAYAEQCAADTRKHWSDSWDAMVIGKRTFKHDLWMTEKTIYCVEGYNKHPFMITDRTTGMMIPTQTIEGARKAFSRIQADMLSKGWTIGEMP